MGKRESGCAPATDRLQSNRLLASLSREEALRIGPHLAFVPLAFGQVLYRYGSLLEYAYFPVTAIVSLAYVMHDGSALEIAIVGHEGVVGLATFENERSASVATVQRAGYGYRLDMAVVRDAFERGGEVPRLLMRYFECPVRPDGAELGGRPPQFDGTEIEPLAARTA